ncbi:MAG: hypothetical protein U0836_19970 [Pirellulales bacterium]
MGSKRWGRRSVLAAMVLLAAPWPPSYALAQTQPAPEAIDLSARRAAIKALSADERERLRRNLEHFESLDEAEKQRLRELAGRVEQSPQRDELRHAMLRYQDWLRRRPAAERAALAALPPEQRVQRIQEQIAQQRHQPPQRLRREDGEKLRSWLGEYLRDHEEELQAASGPAPRWIDPSDTRARQAWLAMMVFGGRRGAPVPPKLLPSDEEMQKLTADLTPEAQRELNARGDRREKLQLLAQWIGLERRGGRRNQDRDAQMAAISQAELARFFEEDLDLEDQLRLVFLPKAEDFDRELRRLYVEEYIVARGDPASWRPGGEPRPSPQPPPAEAPKPE